MAVALCPACASPAIASPLVLNGGFAAGFASWTIADQFGSDGTFHIQTGILSPLNQDSVPAPPGGTFAAMTDAFGPGSHVPYQDFVAGASSATLQIGTGFGSVAWRPFFLAPAFAEHRRPVRHPKTGPCRPRPPGVSDQAGPVWPGQERWCFGGQTPIGSGDSLTVDRIGAGDSACQGTGPLLMRGPGR